MIKTRIDDDKLQTKIIEDRLADCSSGGEREKVLLGFEQRIRSKIIDLQYLYEISGLRCPNNEGLIKAHISIENREMVSKYLNCRTKRIHKDSVAFELKGKESLLKKIEFWRKYPLGMDANSDAPNIYPVIGLTKIMWKGTKEELLYLKKELCENEYMMDMEDEEFLSHFTDSRGKPYNEQNCTDRITWFEDAVKLAQMISFFKEKLLINKQNHYKVFGAHFKDDKNKEFKNLSQQRFNQRSSGKEDEILNKIFCKMIKKQVGI